MTKEQIVLSQNNRYLITPSLLNSWADIWLCAQYVRESQADEISVEDKVLIAQEKAKENFIRVLRREKIEPNEYMVRGIEFEDECYKGNTSISPIIEGGAYQIVGMKKVTILGIKFLMYGRLDVLKAGIIYDIKRVSRYAPQKYFYSYQHPFYMELFPTAHQFTYLPYDDKGILHNETYYPDQVVDIIKVIENFIKYLDNEGLLDIYLRYWVSKTK